MRLEADDADVAVVGGGQLGARGGGIDEVGLARAVRADDQVRGRRQVAEYAGPLGHAVGLAGGHVGEAPDRHPGPALLGREEVPVAHRLAHHRVGDVVGGQAEGIDAEEHLARLELGGIGILEADLVQIVSLYLEVDLRSLFQV